MSDPYSLTRLPPLSPIDTSGMSQYNPAIKMPWQQMLGDSLQGVPAAMQAAGQAGQPQALPPVPSGNLPTPQLDARNRIAQRLASLPSIGGGGYGQ